MNYVTYKPKGESRPINIIIAILIGIIFAIVLGWIYVLNSYIPIVYLAVLITIGFGFILASFVYFLTVLLNIKKKKTKVFIVIIVSVFAYYSQWISFILQVYNQSFPKFLYYLRYWMAPENLLNNIFEINQYGSWGIGVSGTFVNGFPLSAIWVMEAFIIFSISIVPILKISENPFSEKYNKWYPKLVLRHTFQAFYSSKTVMKKIKSKGIDALFDMKNGNYKSYSEISIYYIEGEDIQYLAIDRVSINSKDGMNKEISELIKPIEISSTEARKILSSFDYDEKSQHFFQQNQAIEFIKKIIQR